MPDTHVDYNRIASTYNRRYAGSSEPDGIGEALQALARDLDAKHVLEVGCGTGHWLTHLRDAAPRVYGLDLSTGMLKQAQAGTPRDVSLTCGRAGAGALPFASATFDMVYVVNAIHHFDAQRAFITEARRLLRPGGALAVVGIHPRLQSDWYVYHYFDGTHETDLARFPSWGAVLDWMVEAGFAGARWELVYRIVDHKVGRAVLDDPFLQKDQTSQLSLLSDEAYAAGLRRIEAAIAEAEAKGETCFFSADFTPAISIGYV